MMKIMSLPVKAIFYCIVVTQVFTAFATTDKYDTEFITMAILAKDKAHTLPLYLHCLENQTWPSSRTYLYIRTNNNNDNTAEILREWVDRVKDRYADIYFDATNVEEPVEQFGQHDWNDMKLTVLGRIRQASLEWASLHNSHYFVVDCDNFIAPDTLESLFATQLPIVGPLLWCPERDFYSNFHYDIDENGYYAHSDHYYDVLYRRVKGLIEIPVIHCAYFVHKDVLSKVCYDDGSHRYEYVIFCDSARKNNITQYIDNRKIYGDITFAENDYEFSLYEYSHIN